MNSHDRAAQSPAMVGSSSRVTPPPTPPSPSASFYDVSDDEEGEYSTIKHASSGRGVKLLFSKSKVNPLPFYDCWERALTSTPSLGLCPSVALIER